MSYRRRKDLETLERIKRWPGLKKRCGKVRIFSAEHGYYWRGTGQGYTSDRDKSAVLDIEDAFKATRHCGPEKKIRFFFAE